MGLSSSGRKHAGRAASALPALGTRGQKHRLMPLQLETEVAAGLQRLATLRGLSPLTASQAQHQLEDKDPSLLYAEELLQVAAEGGGRQPAAAQEAAYAELQRLAQYWAEGLYPAHTEEETTTTAAAAVASLSPPQSVSSVPCRSANAWRLSRTRSSPCPVGSMGSSTRAAVSHQPYASAAFLSASGAACRRLPQRPPLIRTCTSVNEPLEEMS